MKKKIIALGAMLATLIVMLGMALSPASATYYEKVVSCDGGNASISGYEGLYTGSGDLDAIVRIYDVPNSDGWHHWDLWLYRNGDTVRTGHEFGPSVTNWYNITNPSGPDAFKFRFANDSRTINCTATIYV